MKGLKRKKPMIGRKEEKKKEKWGEKGRNMKKKKRGKFFPLLSLPAQQEEGLLPQDIRVAGRKGKA